MARRVFFSFHYDRDVRRVVQIRNSWVIRPGDETQPFFDKAEFEEAKKRAGGIQNWIDEQMKHTSVTVVLYGAETYEREWVRYEIKRSYDLRKGLLAIDLYGVKDPQKGLDVRGRNPLEYWEINRNGRQVPLSQIYQSYNWASDEGYANFPKWIETAATAAGR